MSSPFHGGVPSSNLGVATNFNNNKKMKQLFNVIKNFVIENKKIILAFTAIIFLLFLLSLIPDTPSKTGSDLLNVKFNLVIH